MATRMRLKLIVSSLEVNLTKNLGLISIIFLTPVGGREKGVR